MIAARRGRVSSRLPRRTGRLFFIFLSRMFQLPNRARQRHFGHSPSMVFCVQQQTGRPLHDARTGGRRRRKNKRKWPARKRIWVKPSGELNGEWRLISFKNQFRTQQPTRIRAETIKINLNKRFLCREREERERDWKKQTDDSWTDEIGMK